jgi:hypothetical protein
MIEIEAVSYEISEMSSYDAGLAARRWLCLKFLASCS